MTAAQLAASNFVHILPELPPGAEILIIRLRSLGDVVMLTPALAAVHAWRADLRIGVLVEPPFAAVLEGNPAVSEILLFEDFLSCARALRGRKFPVTFNQHGGPTSALLTAAAASRWRVCWEHCRSGFLYNARVPDSDPLDPARKLHTIEHRLLPFYAAGLPRGPIPRPHVFAQAAATAGVQEKLRAAGVAAPYFVLHPGAAYFTKRWSLAGFAEIARWLREQHGLALVVVLGPGDREIAPDVRKHLGDAAAIFDALTMGDLIALIAGARLFLGNDSGPAHIAAAAGVPLAVIFGSSDSGVWRPWQTPDCVVQNEFACNPCRGDRCYAFPEPQCILSVTPEQVQAACENLLKQNRDS